VRGNSIIYAKRHSLLHEKILLSFAFQAIAGLSFLWLFSVLPMIGFYPQILTELNGQNTITATSIALVFTDLVLRKFLRYPGAQSISYAVPTIFVTYAIIILAFIVLRKNYSLIMLFSGFICTLTWCFGVYFLSNRYRISRYALVPFGETKKLTMAQGAEFTLLTKPHLEGRRFNGIIADLRSSKLTPAWEQFLAECTLHRIPVYHTKQIMESLTGRVKIDHLSENEFGALLPSEVYESLKRIIDFLGVVVLLPVLLPVLILTAIWIKLDSAGPVFFLQKRMGFRARVFTMYKFRSMYTNNKGLAYTAPGADPRITRVGRFIRKFRIDEFPQVLNILLGHMSFIGPRPESIELTKSYEMDVPFFAYRHVVRPGISGWAQVNQGYAAELDAMNTKLEYDFYYIKHFSFWLDILITFKTIRTIVTGFGAR
jgi:lipopolysaccharide/colanic/teichoic acid biosynthesis glycosyltransferase